MRALIALAVVVAGTPYAPSALRAPVPQGQVNQTFLVALRDFMYWENYDVRVRMDGKIDRVVLEDILKKRR